MSIQAEVEEAKPCSRCGEKRSASMFLKDRKTMRTVCTPCRVEQNKLARIAKRLSENWPRASNEIACDMAFSQWRAACPESLPIGLVATL